MNNSIGKRVLPLKSLVFNVLTTPDKESGLSCLQSACIEGDIETVSAILNYSPDKLDSAIAFSVKIGRNAPNFAGKSIYTVLRQQDSKKHKQINGFVEKVTKHFQSQSLLHLAAKKGQVEHLRRLLDCGEYVDSISPDLSEDRKTPLMLAARFNEVDVVEFLITERGALLEMQDADYFTALHHAAMGGKTENILRLIELGANVSKENYNQISAIHLAAERGHTEAVRLLLEHGADMKKVNYCGATPLMLAATKGHLRTIHLLLKNGGDLSRSDAEARLPLHYAAQGDQMDVVKFIVQKNGNVLAKTSNGDGVLHLATRLELVRYFVEQHEADIHGRNSLGRTPLHVAALKGQSDTVSYLLNQGADINSREESGRSALFYAVYEGHAAAAKGGPVCDVDLFEVAASRGLTDVLQLLLDRGLCDTVDRVNRYGETPLMEAASGGHYDTVAFLLDHGANVNGVSKTEVAKDTCVDHSDSEDSEKDDDQYTWFNDEREARQTEVAKLLIERGAGTSYPNGEQNTDFDKKASTLDRWEDGETLLTSAASRGDFDAIPLLLEKGMDVNAKNMSGDTILSCVLRHTPSCPRAMEIVKLLLTFGADINNKNDRSETPLQIACCMNFDKVAELLLELGCDTNVKNDNSYSPLHHAAHYNNGKLVEMLLQYGADAKVKSDEGEMVPLHIAATSNSVHAAQVLLEHGASLEVTNALDRTPLAEAAAHGSSLMVKLLTKQGSNVHAKDKFGKTPLILALEYLCYDGDTEIQVITLVKTLLDHGSSVNGTDHYGRSPLHRVPPVATRELCDLFLQHGADVNLEDENRETPLHFAASFGNTACIEWLLQQGANVGALDRENRTPLHAAAYEGHSSSLELLIQHGADVHLADKKGWLPLHFAATRGHAAEVLLQNGSDVTTVDQKGRTALYLAVRSGCRDLIEFLIHQGSDVNAKDVRGRTVFGAIHDCDFWDPEWNFVEVYLENGGDKYAVDAVTGRTTLHFAAVSSDVTTLDNLVNQGLELEARDKNGDTPLHRAAARGTAEMIQRLVDRGADMSAVNNRGQTPLLVCLAASNKEGSKMLLKHGSNVQVADKDGNTALHHAIRLPPSVLHLIIKMVEMLMQ
ncbi:hypothetical protein OS493_011096 [Desmophyllum pertusum]|uniref:Uncharacterized protein n=1 Tax=Desmophyllum pertusum TaxID=174260 RepID=A0A9X0CU39_9CNID|nr:hypothetical protein OS493_011096 [Desmophyllum pertusum]